MSGQQSPNGSILGVLGFALAGFLVYYFTFRQPSTFTIMQQKAAELNEEAPLMVDRITQFDSAVAINAKTYRYYYTVLDPQAEFNEGEDYTETLLPIVTNNVKRDTALAFFRQEQVTLEFFWFDSKGSFISSVAVTPELYQDEND